jgi:acetyltransferase-like isoleucine patch superfamily enzyme/dTDP-4-dehydrorhamnose 3,5-epimerase-like enzyme
MSFFLHPQGICESETIGDGTRIWAFAHILPGAKIGADCNVCDGVFIENDVVVGDCVTVKCGVQLWDGIRIEDSVFIGPNVTFSNDPFPRSKQHDREIKQTTIDTGASIGSNSTILPGIHIGRNSMIGAGTVVTRDVPPYAIVTGNPGQITGYASGEETAKLEPIAVAPKTKNDAGVMTMGSGASLHTLVSVDDMRGSLSVLELENEIPFPVRRVFMVHEVPSAHVRGEHAHKKCQQFLVAASGSVHVIVDDGTTREEVVLEGPSSGLLIPALVWATQYKYSPDAVLVVFASEPYDADDYIRDYEEYLQFLETSDGS